MKIHSSNLQTLLGSFHADVWEVEEVIPYAQSLSEIDRTSLKQEMEKLIESKAVDSMFMRKFISDNFKSDKDAVRFFKGVLSASFEGKKCQILTTILSESVSICGVLTFAIGDNVGVV